MTKRQVQMSAGQVLDVLRAKHFEGSAYAFLREVSNATGYSKRQQRADAIAISCWPSRGLWIAGVEVKVSRGDWLRELKSPEKSADIQRFCTYWWIAAPEGVVKLEELPETWGLIEIAGKSRAVAKAAPKLTPEPLAIDFVASVLRDHGAATGGALQASYDRGRREALQENDLATVDGLKSEVQQAVLAKTRADDALKSLRAEVNAFERATGCSVSGYRHDHGVEIFRAASALRHFNLDSMAASLRSAAEALVAARDELVREQAPKPVEAEAAQ